VSLRSIGAQSVGRRVALELGSPGFLAIIASPQARAVERIAERLGTNAAQLLASEDIRAFAARLHESPADPIIVSGLDALTDSAWQKLDRQRDRLLRDRLTLLVLSMESAERLSRNAPNLASLFGGFYQWNEAPRAAPDPATAEADQATFDILAKQWIEETQSASSVTRKVRHPAYQRIIAMGERAIPPILRDLEREPRMWGPALHAITGALPVPPADAGKVAHIARAWLDWAKDNGYVW